MPESVGRPEYQQRLAITGLDGFPLIRRNAIPVLNGHLVRAPVDRQTQIIDVTADVHIQRIDGRPEQHRIGSPGVIDGVLAPPRL